MAPGIQPYACRPPRNLWDAFRGIADGRRSESALLFKEGGIGFGELAKRAKRVAFWLAWLGLRRGDVLAIQLGKRPEAYALWLASLRQGIPYVFIDPRNPPDRTQKILERVRPALLVSIGEVRNPFGETVRLATDRLDQSWIEGLPQCPRVRPARTNGCDPAYIMFTSGSTGEPKGAVIPHQGVLSLMSWAREHVLPHGDARMSNLNPLHFDNSVFDLYCGLMNGAALAPVETGTTINPMAWVRRLRDTKAAIVFAVPTLFLALDRLGLLTPESLPDVRVFLFGGEGFPIAALRSFHGRFDGRAKLINVYGPTETSCICSSVEVTRSRLEAAGDGFVSLGRMHEDFDHLILDDGGAIATAGELWIGGPNVGLGYYANDAETMARFRQDPRQDRYRSIWYRTGDLVREDEDGYLWFQGRADNQVKVRGHRIELEEIDLAAERADHVQRAVCVALEGADGLELRLAFTSDRTVAPDALLRQLSEALPYYMLPTRAVQFSSLPQNANGKVDRKAVRKLLGDIAID